MDGLRALVRRHHLVGDCIQVEVLRADQRLRLPLTLP
jgi:hypothetical protein